MDIVEVIAEELQVAPHRVKAAIQLIDEGNTIPFIARYRKEMTEELNDEQLRFLSERLTYLRNLEERKGQVIGIITEQGKLTPELEKAISEAKTLVAVEDLYRPYKQKRRTKASIAKEKGLGPLAEVILGQEVTGDLQELAKDYVSEEKGVANAQEALAGAREIIMEQISDEATYRTFIRDVTMRRGTLVVDAKDAQKESVYENYYQFTQPVQKLAGYQVLAINRGEKEEFLNVKVEAPVENILLYMNRKILRDPANPPTKDFLEGAIKEAYTRFIEPSIERELRTALTDQAQEGAIKVFGKNLEQLLMQPPIAGQTVLGWDPGFRTGCKIAVVDSTGKVLDTCVVYATPPAKPEAIEKAKQKILGLIKKYDVSLISLGNGTASRESEQVIVDMLSEIPQRHVQYLFTSEAGASVYSASKLATEEFPNFDVGQRSATSIARRVQDPLAELVKIDPKSIGVGQYQHDMNQKKLDEALTGVVEDCVNKVGVDLNTASASLLQYISGISKTVANNIVLYREENGRFSTRKQLLKVPKLGPKAFEQCAGFLRISEGTNPLDNTGVHPESYVAAEKLLGSLGFSLKDVEEKRLGKLEKQNLNYPALSQELSIGEPTLRDIVKELEKPGRDPRDEMPKPILRTDILSLEDLKEGMVLKGTVRNITDFGAFVDLGVHVDGLIHVSKLKKGRVNHPLEVVSVGDIVTVKVESVDLKKNRIGLNMKDVEQ